MAEVNKRKTPTARIIAAELLKRGLDAAITAEAEYMTSVFDSRVNDKKRAAVVKCAEKMSLVLRRRVTKIVDRYNNPPAPTGKPFPRSETS